MYRRERVLTTACLMKRGLKEGMDRSARDLECMKKERRL